MSLKDSNEITLKIKCELDEFYNIVEEKGFKIIDKFSMDDTYFVPEEVELGKVNTRDILSKAVLVRDIIGKTSNKRTKLITYKIKNIDENGNILNQESINCNILNIEDAKKLLKAIGYEEIMNIKENDVITKINNKKIRNYLYLNSELYKYNLGTTIDLTYIHNGSENKIKVTLTSSE